MNDDRAGEIATGKALAMIYAFASVESRMFDLSITDQQGQEVKGLQRPHRTLEQIRRMIDGALRHAERQRYNVIIRPIRSGPLLVQLDDLDQAKIEQVQIESFLVIRTSPGQDGKGNHQAWVAIKDAPQDADAARDFARRLRKGVGADRGASGAARIAGSRNMKYPPNFPMVEITHLRSGHTVMMQQLQDKGFVAAPEPVRSRGRHVAPRNTSKRRLPSYDMCVQGAPASKSDPNRPDYSLADFTYARIAATWGFAAEVIEESLSELSPCARKNGPAYVNRTVERAVASVDRERRSVSTP